MTDQLKRYLTYSNTLAIADTAGSTGSDYIDMEHAAGGSIQITSTGVSAITWYASNSTANTFGRLRDQYGTQIAAASVDQNEPLPFPNAAYHVRYLKPVGSTGESGTATVVTKT
jgi:hypothetical protein